MLDELLEVLCAGGGDDCVVADECVAFCVPGVELSCDCALLVGCFRRFGLELFLTVVVVACGGGAAIRRMPPNAGWLKAPAGAEMPEDAGPCCR